MNKDEIDKMVEEQVKEYTSAEYIDMFKHHFGELINFDEAATLLKGSNQFTDDEIEGLDFPLTRSLVEDLIFFRRNAVQMMGDFDRGKEIDGTLRQSYIAIVNNVVGDARIDALIRFTR